MSSWDPTSQGVLTLPSGRLVRGRSLARSRRAAADERPDAADFELILLGRQREFESETHGPAPAMDLRWVAWPDFALPKDRDDAADAFVECWRRAEFERVGVACSGGRGRTGTALACLAVLDGVTPTEAVAFVRTHYDVRAVETPWQRRFVERFDLNGTD